MRVLFVLALFIAAIAAASCGGSENLDDASVDMGMPLLNESDNHKVGWGRDDCTSCHPFLPEVHPRLVELPGYSPDRVCVSCHLGNGTGFNKKIPECVFCHTNGALPVQVEERSAHSLTRVRDDDVFTPPTAKAMKDVDCVICHDSANMDGIFTKSDLSDFNKWDRVDINGFCLTCHSPEGVTAQVREIKPADIKSRYSADYHGAGEYTDRGYGNDLAGGYEPSASALSCLSCHTNHSSANRKLFIERFAGADGEHSVSLNNPDDLRDICTRCHENSGGTAAPNGKKQTLKHNGLSSNGWCFKCHPSNGHAIGAEYAESMMAEESGGAGCASCHRHGANLGVNNTEYPYGTVNHSIF
jgi:hypothetical protein